MRSQSQEWEDCDMNGFSEINFIHNFRMSRATFNYICQHLSRTLSWQDTQLSPPISLRKQVGVGLYLLATGAGYRTLLNLLGLAKSSVCSIVHEFCKALHHVLMPQYINTSSYLKEMSWHLALSSSKFSIQMIKCLFCSEKSVIPQNITKQVIPWLTISIVQGHVNN